MSSSAFFIDAAANTVMVLSCAVAGGRRGQEGKANRNQREKAVASGHHGGSVPPARNRASLLGDDRSYREPPFRTLRARAQRAITLS